MAQERRETILVIEDEEGIRRLVELYLQKHNYEVMSCANGEQIVSIVQYVKPALVILDVVLPGQDGLTCCKQIRQVSTVPILFLSCKSESEDIIAGLSVGGDDYLCKPFQFDELIARVKALIRRSTMPFAAAEQNIIRIRDLEINTEAYTVKLAEQEIPLSSKEYELLLTLIKNPNRVYRTEDLYQLIWKNDSIGDSRTVMVHIYNLRKKLYRPSNQPQLILTVRGVGYKFNGMLLNE